VLGVELLALRELSVRLKTMKAIRIFGFLIGFFIITSSLMSNSLASSKVQILHGSAYWSSVIPMLVLSLPLVIPWSFSYRYPWLWLVLFIFLCLLMTILTWGVIQSCWWAYHHGEQLQKIMFPAIGGFTLTIIGLQIPIALKSRRSNYAEQSASAKDSECNSSS
jgi:hypothetical protein